MRGASVSLTRRTNAGATETTTMGKLARIVDWTHEDAHVAPRALDSGICLKAFVAEPIPDEGDPDEDEPTRPYERIAPLREKSPRVERERPVALAVARLRTLIDWLSEAEDTGVVVGFVRSFLAHLEELNFAIGQLREKSADSLEIGDAVEAFSNATLVWRANLVDYVDELALTEYRSLDAWSSLPEYSSTYVLAFIAPTLAALKDRMSVNCAQHGEAELLPSAWVIEAAIVRLNWMLTGVAARSAYDAAAE
jgi:hypothetical protein